jgi:hypothetical protein
MERQLDTKRELLKQLRRRQGEGKWVDPGVLGGLENTIAFLKERLGEGGDGEP